MQRIGVIGINGAWSTEQLAQAFRRDGAHATVIEMGRVVCGVGAGGRAACESSSLNDYDALVVKKIGKRYSPDLLDRLTLLDDIEASGGRVFSRPGAIRAALDRLSCTLRLSQGDIPIPPTVVTEDVDRAAGVVQRFERAVLKPLYTSKARGMVIVETGPDLRDRIARYQNDGNRMIYIQKLIPLPGRDLGVVFLGGEFVGCYARVGDGLSWNTTTVSGGRYEAHTPDDDIIELARKAQALFGLDFTCVDVAQSTDGPVVFEVSAFGGFRGLLEAQGIDAATLYARHVLAKLRHRAG